MKKLAAIGCSAAFAFGLLVPPPAPATAASKPYFKGTVHVWYKASSQWNVPAAAKAAGLGSIKLRKVSDDSDPLFCDERNPARQCLMLWSIDFDTVECDRPWRVKKAPVVCYYDRHGQPDTSGRVRDASLEIDDRQGRKMTAAQRHAHLVAQLKRAIPRR